MYYNSNKNKIDNISISLLLYLIPIFIYFYKTEIIFSTLGLCCTWSSYLYHITNEQSKLYLYIDMFFAITTLNYLLFDLLFITTIYIKLYFLVLVLLSFCCYIKGSGRNKTINRSVEYEKYHLLWHILLFILSLSHSYFK